MRQKTITIICFLVIFSTLLQGQARKNILLITIDTLRYDRVSIYNDNFVKTPNIDKLAKKSVIFKRAFAHTPLTLPSHANILTGTTPLYHGISDNNRFRLDDKFLTLAEHLKPSGYRTAAFTASFVLNKYFKLDQGFDLYHGPDKSNELIAEEVVRSSIEWLKDNEGPWFLWIHIWDPHAPYSAPEPFGSRFRSDPYSGEVAYTDSQLGILFKYIENSGLMKNTAIVLTGDHGEALGDHGEQEHGYFAYNETIHIPLIIYDPSLDDTTINKNVSHIDIFPTICELTGVKIPGHIQGRSLLPVIKGVDKSEETIYFEAKSAYYSRGWAPLDGFITKNRKFINLPIKELYDLKKDFGEKRNIISRVTISELFSTLNPLISGLTGADKDLSEKKIDPKALKKLKTFGYLTGVVQKKKTIFTKEDDLKVLLPIQLKLTEARKLEKKGKYREALELFMEVRKLKPDNISTYINIAELFHKTNRIREGLETIEEGLAKSPSNTDLLLRKGVLLVVNNQLGKGENILRNVLSIDPDRGEAWNYLGISLFKKGLMGKALEAYRKSEEIDNTNPTLFNNIATLYLSMYLKQKDPELHENAVINFKKALEIDKNLSSALNGLGAAYRFSGNREEAIKYWKSAIEHKPDFIQVYFNLAITLLETGDKTGAKRYLKILKDKYYSRLDPRSRGRLERLLSEL